MEDIQTSQYTELKKSSLRHDIRNYLHVALGYSGLLIEESDNTTLNTFQEIASGCHGALITLSKLLEEWFLFDDNNAPTKHEHQPTTFPIRNLSTGLLRLLRNEAKRKGVLLTIDPVSRDIVISGIYHVIERALFNVLLNSIQYSGLNTKINVWFERDKNTIICHCQDNGPGFPEEVIIGFEDQNITVLPSKNENPGTEHGIGLLSSKYLIENFGGTMEIKNPPEGGALVTIRIPRILDPLPTKTEDAPFIQAP